MPTLSLPARPARTLQAAAALQAQRRYLQRLAELREMASPLAQLDEEHARLAEWGLSVDPGTLYLARERVGAGLTLRTVVRLYTANSLADANSAQTWLDALASCGFNYVSQDDDPYMPSVLLRKGLLHVRIDMPRHKPAAQARAAALPQPTRSAA
jgi:hypothetical protein